MPPDRLVLLCIYQQQTWKRCRLKSSDFGFNIQVSESTPIPDVQEFQRSSMSGQFEPNWQVYRDHWDKLHRMPIELDTWDTQEAMGWFMRWNADIPHINCSCRSDWSELISQHPIEISTRLSFAIWCWHRHNDVNAKLRETQGGHPHFEWSDCCDIHGYPEDWKSAELDQPHQLSTSSGLCSDCS
jgi:Erv1 / Alr family